MNAPAGARRPVLAIWPGVPAWRIGGRLHLDRKFKDGMDIWARQWPGQLRAVMEVVDLAALPPFGAHAWQAGAEAFELEVIEPAQAFSAAHLQGVDLLLASADDPRKLVAAELCAAAGVRCVYSIEYTFATRFLMNWWSEASRFQKLKTSVWLLLNELRLRRALARAASVQANGIPAFELYARGARNGQLYFDTRLEAAAVIPARALDARTDALLAGRPLRLAFSGRLIASKGADALIPLAARLRQLGVAFQLDIYGSGELEPAIAAGIGEQGLQSCVTLHGPVDFATALIPALQRDVDLFVCCHRQGDPSCTYAETLGCGVPFVGYANESLRALVQRFDVGWVVPMNDEHGLAALVQALDRRRGDIRLKSVGARAFALEHTFESTFQARLEHCKTVIS